MRGEAPVHSSGQLGVPCERRGLERLDRRKQYLARIGLRLSSSNQKENDERQN